MHIPEVREIVLVVGDVKNREHWMKGKVETLIKGKSNVVREVILRHMGHLMKRPLQAVYSVEIRSDVNVVQEYQLRMLWETSLKIPEEPDEKVQLMQQ